MAGVFSQSGLLEALNLWRLVAGAGQWDVGLFDVAHTPLVTDTAATYNAIESDFGGYVRQTLPGSLTPFWDGVDRYTAQFDSIQFIWDKTGSPPVVYGYFVVRQDGVLMWADNAWGGGLTLAVAANTLTFLPEIDETNLFA